MSIVIPSDEEIRTLPTPLTAGEEKVLVTLKATLDDDWTIYVQPHLNGLNPDFVIFSPTAGIGIIEVKDWNLDHYTLEIATEQEANDINRSDQLNKKTARKTVSSNYLSWSVFDSKQDRYVLLNREKCPFTQVQRYKDSIIQYEIPVLDAWSVLNESNHIYALIVPIVFFTLTYQQALDSKLEPLQDDRVSNRQFNYLSADYINNPKQLRAYFAARHLKRGSKFSDFMMQYKLKGRLENALGYATHGHQDLEMLRVTWSSKQLLLLPNIIGSQSRVRGVPGSGKSILIVQKAVNAAIENRKVLVVCFNITMVHQLREMCNRLAKSFNSHAHRNIEVAHYHRLFKLSGEPRGSEQAGGVYSKELFEVILIDEGQDLRYEWVKNLLTLCVSSEKRHYFFAEDERQDIYLEAQSRKYQVPEIPGRPNLLTHTFRLPFRIVQLANLFSRWANIGTEMQLIDDPQPVLPGFTDAQNRIISSEAKITWVDGLREQVIDELTSDVISMWNDGTLGPLADAVILVCEIPDGWDIHDAIEQAIPNIRTFETRKQNQEYGVSDSRSVDENIETATSAWSGMSKVQKLRRAYKVAFRMQTGRLKLATIHSFKGWELNKIFLFFDPSLNQVETYKFLLYTAITRCQKELRVYNTIPEYFAFSKLAREGGLLD